MFKVKNKKQQEQPPTNQTKPNQSPKKSKLICRPFQMTFKYSNRPKIQHFSGFQQFLKSPHYQSNVGWAPV